MRRYRPVIGLEVHAELTTQTKMFCTSRNDPDETRPNVNVCPVCMAHPGTLPTINREAVRHILRIGSAVQGTFADYSEFDRKSYFYPDIPKGYQISQYLHPLISGGVLAGVPLTRIHLEEDTARSVHAGGKSLVDFNRAGIPLMELVTEPVIPDAETAGRFARELQLLLRTLGAGHANLEKGEMRIEANVSVARESETFGTKVEIKNLNSFRSVERAIAFEIERQSALLDSGGEVVQETRGWDEGAGKTFHQRFKEGSADYRYFPEPDLPKIILSDIPEFHSDAIRATLPELPEERRERYRALNLKDADVAYLTSTFDRAQFFDAVSTALNMDPSALQLAINYLSSDVEGLLAKKGVEEIALDPSAFAKLITLIQKETLSSRGAKEVLAVLIEKGGDPETIAGEQGLTQIHDRDALGSAVDAVITREQKAVGEYKAGEQAALQFLIGMTMRETKGAANPDVLKQLLTDRLQ